MKVYISSPYTVGDVAENVRRAIEAADAVAALGHTPFIPHLSHFWHLVSPHPYEFWMKQDMEWLESCDVVLRLPGESAGADHECLRAQELGKPIYYSLLPLGMPQGGPPAAQDGERGGRLW